jgi:hypothetical protein
VWKNFRDPSSIQLDEVMNLKMLGIELLFLGGEEEAFDYKNNCMMLLRRFKRIHNLHLLIFYLPVSSFLSIIVMCLGNEENKEFQLKEYARICHGIFRMLLLVSVWSCPCNRA